MGLLALHRFSAVAVATASMASRPLPSMFEHFVVMVCGWLIE